MSKPHALFVDDEKNILLGLKRLLREMRNDWEMSFASHGEEALEICRTSEVNLVVSDMRMPDINGAELLSKIRRHYPQTIRFVLSGQCDIESALSVAQSAHQFLSKPCDGEALRHAANRALSILHSGLSESDRLYLTSLALTPLQSEIFLELRNALADPDTGIGNIRDIALKDISLSLKAIQIAHSSFFGTGYKGNSPGEAMEWLGLETIRSLINKYTESFDKTAGYSDQHQLATLHESFQETIAGRGLSNVELVHYAGAIAFLNIKAEKKERTPDELALAGKCLFDLWGLDTGKQASAHKDGCVVSALKPVARDRQEKK